MNSFFIIWIDLKKFSITPLVHRLILCREWVPSEWEADKNSQYSRSNVSNLNLYVYTKQIYNWVV